MEPAGERRSGIHHRHRALAPRQALDALGRRDDGLALTPRLDDLQARAAALQERGHHDGGVAQQRRQVGDLAHHLDPGPGGGELRQAVRQSTTHQPQRSGRNPSADVRPHRAQQPLGPARVGTIAEVGDEQRGPIDARVRRHRRVALVHPTRHDHQSGSRRLGCEAGGVLCTHRPDLVGLRQEARHRPAHAAKVGPRAQPRGAANGRQQLAGEVHVGVVAVHDDAAGPHASQPWNVVDEDGANERDIRGLRISRQCTQPLGQGPGQPPAKRMPSHP